MIPLWGAIIGAASLVTSLLVYLLTDTQTFAPGACERVDKFLTREVVGQDIAVTQLVDAVCTHLSHDHPSRPLVVSVHGPPGVGKTYSHTLLARALYNSDPYSATQCPGVDCRGAKVIYGLDFTHDAREQQLAAVRNAILQHARSVRDPLIVIEEYDKLDCHSRGLLRQLLSNPEVANVTLDRAIILLESNLGFSELEAMVLDVGRDQITAEQAEKRLRDLVFASWRRSGCEEFPDTLKLVSLIDFFLPFFPLQREQVQELVVRSLRAWATQLWRDKHTQMEWGQEVVDFLTDKVDFDGPFPLEGGKQVSNVATRYLSRLVRTFPAASKPTTATAAAALASALQLGEGKTQQEASAAADTRGAVAENSVAVGAWSASGRGPGTPGSPVMRVVVQGRGLHAALLPTQTT